MKLTDNSRYTLRKRYLIKNENREVIETPRQLFGRVSKAIAEVELKYGKSKKEVSEFKKAFYKMMTRFEFLPNSPTLMNGGLPNGQLAACFVLQVDDDIKSIMMGVTNAVFIHKSGGGTGFSFSRLRPKGDIVKTTGGIASGPISFMQIYDVATETIKQGGKRRGANMGILRVDHPDIIDFIVEKEKEGHLANFNLSVAVTDKFMEAVIEDKDYDLINPRTGKVVKSVAARGIWNLLITMSWKNGEPAVIFLDTINKYNPTPKIGLIEATNPCGEQPLLPYESCNLGSINLSKFRKNGSIDWNKLKKVVRLAVRFLDNVIDANIFPLPEIKEKTIANRKIGLGVMGWSDLLLNLGIRYDSQRAINLAEKIMKFIKDEGLKMSVELAQEKGSFPNKDKSVYKDVPALRNATITTIAPTGTLHIIANCSQGIEPIFALVEERNVAESMGKKLIEINSAVRASLELKGLWNSEVEQSLKQNQCIECLLIDEKIKRAFVTAEEINPEWHVKMQAAFQKHTDNAVSKTVNLPTEATITDIEQIYFLAHKMGCKGITVYRNGSRKNQLLTKGIKCPTC